MKELTPPAGSTPRLKVIEVPEEGVAVLYSMSPFGQIAPARREERRHYAWREEGYIDRSYRFRE
jgi:hypothetical protein